MDVSNAEPRINPAMTSTAAGGSAHWPASAEGSIPIPYAKTAPAAEPKSSVSRVAAVRAEHGSLSQAEHRSLNGTDRQNRHDCGGDPRNRGLNHSTRESTERGAAPRRTAEGKTKAEIIRCLKRLLARKIWALLRPLRLAAATTVPAS